MPCYRPIRAYKTPGGVVFKPSGDAKSITLDCGQCIGCRLERSRQWAVRLMHELRFHERSSFITLTYSDANLPKSGSLNVKHFQDFMKRLRFEIAPRKVRFFHAGEYGEKKGRPHYHAIIFGEDFFDGAYDFEETFAGDDLWSSPVLDRLWSFGMNRVGSVSFESCAYVARYVTKKVTGRNAADHYWRYDHVTGECFDLKPEYATMSRRPGIGRLHFDSYFSEMYPRDEVVSRGFPCKPPKFYDRCLEAVDPELFALVKEGRELALESALQENPVEFQDARREVKESVKLAQIKNLSRRYEFDG